VHNRNLDCNFSRQVSAKGTGFAPQSKPELPDDLAAVLAALTTRWPEMREGEKAAIKALCGA
jgi:hypothetical protein